MPIIDGLNVFFQTNLFVCYLLRRQLVIESAARQLRNLQLQLQGILSVLILE